jgi:hypothetical protein
MPCNAHQENLFCLEDSTLKKKVSEILTRKIKVSENFDPPKCKGLFGDKSSQSLFPF